MEIKIEKQEHKPLVERDEIIVKIESKITPSNAHLKEEIAKKLNKEQELVIIKKIDQKFGEHKANALAYVYKSHESLLKFEPKKKEKKEKVEEKKEEKKE